MSMDRAKSYSRPALSTLLVVLALMVGSGYSQSPDLNSVSNVAPTLPASAHNLGAEDASKEIAVTVWLRQRNKAELDSMVREMYDKSSPNYHHFLTREQYRSKFAPTAQDAGTVRNYLAANSLKVTSIERN